MKTPPKLKVLKRAITECSNQPFIIWLEATPWKTDDAAWFSAHPLRSFRIRRIYPNEWPNLDKLITHSLVRQLEPGYRDRTPVNSNIDDNGASIDEMLNDVLNDDVLLMTLWQASSSGVDFISLQTLIKRASELRTAGSGGLQ
jgi:hypothetical protein